MSTKFTELVAIDAAGGDVVFDGVDFTLNAYIEVRNANSLTIRNCRFYKMNLPGAKNYLFKVIGDIPCKLVVEQCFFGDNPKNGSNTLYNILELNAQLKTGSSFSKNYFTADSCTHNHINVYGASETAKIFIDDNVFEQNAGIRIGVKGEPACTIYLRRNENKAVAEGAIENLILLQPYGNKTTSFANMTIVCDGNKTVGEDFPIMWYCGKNDLQLTDELMPAIVDNNGTNLRDQLKQYPM